MFRERQKLRKYCGATLYHTELAVTNGVVERVQVNDCEKLPPAEDFDLELNLRAGENLKEVSTIVTSHGRVNLTVKEKEQNEIQNQEIDNEK